MVSRILDKKLAGKPVTYKHMYDLPERACLGIGVIQDNGRYRVNMITDIDCPVVLHWGLAKNSRNEWSLPPSSVRPDGTTLFKNQAAETPFQDGEGLRELQLVLAENGAPLGISFVLRCTDDDIWLNDQGRNFFIPIVIPPQFKKAFKDPRLAVVADEIIDREMGNHSWTLMHRFNLCYDLLDKVGLDEQGLALLFVWLRFSAIRQLDWQRNYNTQPRELSHAQDRLTQKLAGIYARKPMGSAFIRLMLTTMGRGGEGQRVRDEVLNIMHRHHIKEVSGHFMEEWHQKLHNNTTPDDVVICQAYLDFLRSNGNLEIFYGTLQAGGVTKNRLRSYERPIVSDPDFIPHLKEALIHDFEVFLKILKGVHAAIDLETAMEAARGALESDLRGFLDSVLASRHEANKPVTLVAEDITTVRRRLTAQIGKNNQGARDLLFLDLALEDFLRLVIEKNLHMDLTGEHLLALTSLVLDNVLMTADDEEISCCLQHWEHLTTAPSFERPWALEANAVMERLGRALGAMIDRYVNILQPKAELLGKAFQAEPWAVSVFTEEVVRGRLVFLLSMLLRKIEPLLRERAHLGNWQIVSPGEGRGELLVVKTLQSIQEKQFSHQSVIVAHEISGQEEIPQNITAIITPDTTDIVSHVAIRARNAHVLLATCYDNNLIERLQALEGRWVLARTSPAGDVHFDETAKIPHAPSAAPVPVGHTRLHRPEFTAYALPSGAFSDKILGGKSNNLKRLKGNLPAWIHLPASAAIPFGVFEKVLTHNANQTIASRYAQLNKEITSVPAQSRLQILKELQQTILELQAPDQLVASVQGAMDEEGLPLPGVWEDAWTCVKRVWASKWNERAFLSRQTRGIAHEDLFMAVLIQQVVEADYSFVVHTANPVSGDAGELYAEVVVGLGETLVGNYPGRACSFTYNKKTQELRLLSFPSKSLGLFGGGLIFRSDSNGEDLADYAGAGLYDSIMLKPPQQVRMDYTGTPLVADETLRLELMKNIAAIGIAVEDLLGIAQDIEGACCQGKYYVVQTRPQVGLASE